MNQSGRSMVEMLGVLAIIGVLSVGSIAGYSSAMYKYKLNKQSQQLNQIINTVARYVYSFNDVARTLTTSKNYTEILIKLGEVPKEMIKANDKNKIYDSFNTGVDFYLYPAEKGQALVHLFPDLTKKSLQNTEICRNILYVLKENSHIISSVGFVSNYNQDGSKSNHFLGDASCKSGSVCLNNMTMEQINNACSNHLNQQSFWFDVWFKT